MKQLNLASSLLLGLVLSPALQADTIFLSSGKPIEDCKIAKEDLKEITYKVDGSKDRETVASEKVIRIEHERLPKLVDRAEEALRSNQIDGALADLEDYLDSVLSSERGDRRFPWGPAYALHRVMVLRNSLGDTKGVIQAADRLIEKAPDSFYLPAAFLTKAEALAVMGKGTEARSTIRDFHAMVESKNLARRWKLEADLALALFDPELKPAARTEQLITIADTAGEEYPTVKSRADLATAETWLEAKKFDKAQVVLQNTVEAARADARTMAGAHTGLGDCLFQSAVDEFEGGDQAKAEKLLQEALLHYMRVVVTYLDQSRYVSKSMFFAGRAFDQFQDDESKRRAQRMYREVIRQFPQSGWAKEARDYRK